MPGWKGSSYLTSKYKISGYRLLVDPYQESYVFLNVIGISKRIL